MLKPKITPQDVTPTLKKHMLVDGYETILDLDKSKNGWFVDARDHREYVDFFNGVSSMPLGFNHPKLMTDEAIRHLGRVAVNKPANADAYTPEMASFVDSFAKVLPDYFKYMFFIEGGAAAVENAIKAAMDWKVQKNFAKGYTEEHHPDGYGTKVLSFAECFHGRGGYTLSMTDSPDPRKTRYFAKFDWPRVSTPKAIFPLEGENLEKTIAREKKTIAEIEEACATHKDEICCAVIEPIQGEGGDNHFRPEFMRELRRLADEHEFLLIFDEVQTGLGLTGKMWAHEHYGVAPDCMSFGKKTQVCGFVAGPRLDEVENNVFKVSSRINSTWGGNLIDMVRCEMYLHVYEEENILDHVTKLGEHLMNELHSMEKEFDGVIENVRGRGLFCAMDLTDKIDRGMVLNAAREHGVIILPTGHHGVRFRPALTMKKETLDEGLTRLRNAIKDALGA